MKNYKVIKLSNMWSTSSLTKEVEMELDSKSKEGWDVVTVSFGLNLWWIPTAYITLKRKDQKLVD